MPYLIDGHNLIPKIPGLDLKSLDDELQLIKKLQDFCQFKRKQVEVFFDNASPGQGATRKFGPVIAHFVHRSSTEDQAIQARLKALDRSARNWTVVSSDRAVQAAARSFHAKVLSSEEFTSQMTELPFASSREIAAEPTISEQEIQDWLQIFQQRDSQE